jgi:hypothetical protein
MSGPSTDDRSASIHWAPSKNAARGSLFYVFENGVRITECWNANVADRLVQGLRQLSDCQRPTEENR